jgi:hypothetical protein
MRHPLIALPLAVLAGLALASVALAGGWAQVTVKDAPLDPPAGGGTPIDLRVLQHGATPVSWPHLTVIATDATSGESFLSRAQAKGAEGSYVATLVFPTAGDWTLTFESPELVMEGSAVLNVVAPAAAAPAVQPAGAEPVAADPAVVAEPVATSPGFDLMLLIVPLLAAAIFIVVAGVLIRRGSSAPHTRVTART